MMIAIAILPCYTLFQGSICFDNMLKTLVYREMATKRVLCIYNSFLPCNIGERGSNRWIIWIVSTTLFFLKLFYIKEYMGFYAYQGLALCLFSSGFACGNMSKVASEYVAISIIKKQKRRHLPFAFWFTFVQTAHPFTFYLRLICL